MMTVHSLLISWLPGGSDWRSLSAFSSSVTTSVYKYFEHRTLNFTLSLVLIILTAGVKNLY